jgi:hypothetical protein
MAAPNQRLTGQNPPLSDSDIRRVSQTDGLQRLTVRRLTISRGPHPIFAGLYRPTFGFFIVHDCGYCSCGHGLVKRRLGDNLNTCWGLKYVYCFSRQFKRKKLPP